MAFFLSLHSFFKPRYRFMFAGLITVILHGIITSLYLSHFLHEKYGVSLIKIAPDNMDMWYDCDKITSISLLFYPIIVLLSLFTFFLLNKQRKELRTGILLYLLTTILVFGYIFSFSESVISVIAPVLMLIGAISSHRGGHEEAKRVFILLFLILLFAY